MSMINAIEKDLINSLDEVAFEEGTTDKQKIESIQSALYQYSQIMDALSISAEEEYFNEGFRR